MNGAISTEVLEVNELLRQLQAAPSMAGLNLVQEVTTHEPYEWGEPTETLWECYPEDETAEPALTWRRTILSSEASSSRLAALAARARGAS